MADVVRVRSQPYRVDGDWSGYQASNIDEMFQILFDDLKLLANNTVGTTGTGGIFEPQSDFLDALAALTGTGFLVKTGTDTVTTRSITGGANISVSDGTGVAANPVIAVTGIGTTIQAHDDDLDALAALSGTGIVVRTGSGTAATRTLVAGTNITITNPSGVAGDITIDSSGGGGGGTDVMVAIDTYQVLSGGDLGWSVTDSFGSLKVVGGTTSVTRAMVAANVSLRVL